MIGKMWKNRPNKDVELPQSEATKILLYKRWSLITYQVVQSEVILHS